MVCCFTVVESEVMWATFCLFKHRCGGLMYLENAIEPLVIWLVSSNLVCVKLDPALKVVGTNLTMT